MDKPQPFSLPFVKKEQVAHETYSFFFDREGQPDFDFTAGQYIRMSLEIENPDERGSSHYFTISSSPLEKEYLTITTKIVVQASTFKQTLSSLTPGTPVRFFGPNGDFTLPEHPEKPIVFLAGGIGITPSHSMITFAAKAGASFAMTLFVSFSTVEEAVFYDELKKIGQEHENVQIVYTVTHLFEPEPQSRRPEESTQPWSGETGRISADMIKNYIQNVQNAQYYISGPQKMVSAMAEITSQMGVPEEQVKKEDFPGY
jgi:ferredoxin-NADP reductase